MLFCVVLIFFLKLQVNIFLLFICRRWLRLLFGQEFALPDLLFIWDAVFAEGDGLVNYIVIAMLSAIRDECE